MSRRKLASKQQQYEVAPQYPRRARKPQQVENNIVNFNSFVKEKRKPIALIPRSLKQEEYIDLLNDPEKAIVFATGPAGTGKTMLAVVAAIKAFREGVIQKIVVTRPAVGVDEEEHGFLPGDLNEKMAPWTRPIFDVMKEYFSTKEIAMMLEDETIEISPLAYMRGRNFKDAWIIADEMQNASVNQMKMILTRLGENSRIVVTGDLNQTDKKFQHDNGLIDFLTKLNDSPRRSMGLTQFERKDVQRSKVVSEVLDLYGED